MSRSGLDSVNRLQPLSHAGANTSAVDAMRSEHAVSTLQNSMHRSCFCLLSWRDLTVHVACRGAQASSSLQAQRHCDCFGGMLQ